MAMDGLEKAIHELIYGPLERGSFVFRQVTMPPLSPFQSMLSRILVQGGYMETI